MSDFVIATKEHIKKIHQKARDIRIQINKNKAGHYTSKIEVIAPHQKLVAIKTDSQFKPSLKKAYLAIIRQVHKLKTRTQKKHFVPLKLTGT